MYPDFKGDGYVAVVSLQDGNTLSQRGQLTKLMIKTVAGSQLNPYDVKEATELVVVLHKCRELSYEDYQWCIQNNIRWA